MEPGNRQEEERMSVNVRELLEQKCCNNIAACTNEQIYYGLLGIVKDMAKEKESQEGKKKIYFRGIFDWKTAVQ